MVICAEDTILVILGQMEFKEKQFMYFAVLYFEKEFCKRTFKLIFYPKRLKRKMKGEKRTQNGFFGLFCKYLLL